MSHDAVTSSASDDDVDEIICGQCGERFVKTNNYTRHMKFVHSYVVIDHFKCELTHTKKKAYLFKYSRNFRKHLRSDHGIVGDTLDNMCKNATRVSIHNKPVADHKPKTRTVKTTSVKNGKYPLAPITISFLSNFSCFFLAKPGQNLFNII